MRRVISKLSTLPIAQAKPVRFCVREGCGHELAPVQKKYCTRICRNLVLSEGKNSYGSLPTHIYKPEYASTKFEEYLKFIEEKNELRLLPTNTSYIVIPNARIPTLEHYAEWLGLGMGLPTYYDWADQYPDWALCMDRLKRIQKDYLLNNGLNGRYNSVIAKLALGVNHGMIERKEVDNRHQIFGLVEHLYATADEIEQERKKLHGDTQ